MNKHKKKKPKPWWYYRKKSTNNKNSDPYKILNIPKHQMQYLRENYPNYLVDCVLTQMSLTKLNKSVESDFEELIKKLHFKKNYEIYSPGLTQLLQEIASKWDMKSLLKVINAQTIWFPKYYLEQSPIDGAKSFIDTIGEIENFKAVFSTILRDAEIYHQNQIRVKKEQERIIALEKEQKARELNAQYEELFEKSRAILKARAARALKFHLIENEVDMEDLNKKLLEPEKKIYEFPPSQNTANEIAKFLNNCVKLIDHQYVAIAFPELIFKFKDIYANEYQVKLVNHGINSIWFEFASSDNIQKNRDLSGRTIRLPSGFISSVSSLAYGNRIPFNYIEFSRPALKTDLFHYWHELLRFPSENTLVESFFRDPSFFGFGNTCKNCGRSLINVISAIRAIGPTCGTHDYKWENQDIQPIVRLISDKVKSETFFLPSNPMIEYRSKFRIEPVLPEAANVGKFNDFLLEDESLDQKLLSSLISRRLGRSYYSTMRNPF